MPSSGYTAITFVANEQPTTAKWNLIGSNDSSFNLGTGLEDNVILERHIAATARLKYKIIKATKNLADASGNNSYTGVGFRPTAVVAIFYGPGSATHGIGLFNAEPSGTGVGVNGAGTAYQDTTIPNTIFSLSPSSGNAHNAALVSMDADGFTLGWNKIGTPTGVSQLSFLCFR